MAEPASTPEKAAADPAPEPVRAAAQPDTSLTVADVRRLWSEILAAVKEQNRTAQALLDSAAASALRLDGGVLYLGTRHAALARMISESRNIDVVRGALRSVLGVDWRVRCEVSEEEPGGLDAAPPPAVTTATPAAPSPTSAATTPNATSARPAAAEPRRPAPADDADDQPDPDTDPVDMASYEVVDRSQAALKLLEQKLGARPIDEP